MSGLHKKFHAAAQKLKEIICGKDELIDLCITALLIHGHILLSDAPGVGKTTLAKAIAKLINADFKRIQFTPDLLPADILGGSVYNQQSGKFVFFPGPVFCNILLADEINRASPRAQSALLEAMNEKQISIEGKCLDLPDPFFVIATKNPLDHHGTYPLPESQLDRFTMALEMGYPDLTAELKMINDRENGNDPLSGVEAILSTEDLKEARQQTELIKADASIKNYALELVRSTRENPDLTTGASPRALLTLLQTARASAWMDQRDFLIPDDIKKLVQPVLAHRLTLSPAARNSGLDAQQVLAPILENTRIPL